MISSTRVENPLKELSRLGQSVWLDYIRRNLITSGELKRLVDEGLGGVTSNPASFEKAITGSDDYADILSRENKNASATEIYERLAIRDIQDAADILRPVFDRTNGRDGFVSLEVSPYLANETKASIEEARRLWKMVDRPNLMVKIPGTEAGVPAIEQAISEGININVTLLFAQEMYEKVANAYIAGLEKAKDPSRIASVASFFVSRIDSLIDSRIDAKLKSAAPEEKKRLEALHGKVAIANAKLAYQIYKKVFSGPRWDALVKRGAM